MADYHSHTSQAAWLITTALTWPCSNMSLLTWQFHDVLVSYSDVTATAYLSASSTGNPSIINGRRSRRLYAGYLKGNQRMMQYNCKRSRRLYGGYLKGIQRMIWNHFCFGLAVLHGTSLGETFPCKKRYKDLRSWAIC